MAARELWVHFAYGSNPYRLQNLAAESAVELEAAGQAERALLPREAVHARAEQAYRPAPGFGALEQGERARDDLLRLARGRDRGMAARSRAEIGIAHLDRDRAREQVLAREPVRTLARHALDFGAYRVEFEQIFVVGVFAARGLIR